MEGKLCFDRQNKFRILQLTDLQFDCDIDKKSKAVFEAVVGRARPDMIILTGDNLGGEFLLGRRGRALSIAGQIAHCIDAFAIPWTLCFGNHDGAWSKKSKSDMLAVYSESEYFLDGTRVSIGEESMCDEKSDTYTNYFFPVLDAHGKEAFGILVLDCKTAVFSSYKGFNDSQLAFYKKVSEKHKGLPIAMFTHIPVRLMQRAYDEKHDAEKVLAYTGEAENPKAGKIYYPEKDEKANLKLQSAIEKYDNVRGIFVGHDHMANFAAVYAANGKKPILAAYGRLSSYGMSAFKYAPFMPNKMRAYNVWKRGGRVVDLYADGNISTYEILYDAESEKLSEHNLLSLRPIRGENSVDVEKV